MSGKYALVIGNTEYIDPGLAQLTAPSKDVKDFAQILNDPNFCGFDDVKVHLNDSESVVREAIDEFFEQKNPGDLLVFYFSGHGVRDEFGTLYLAVRNTNRSRLRSTAIKSDFIKEAMSQCRSKRQVLILDCCNSGAFAQGAKAATGASIGTASAFEAGYGRVILTASDSTQFAWEGNKIIGKTDNSLFTHYLVEGLKGDADRDGDGYITVDELYDYAYAKVRLATPKQTPSKFSDKQQGEIVLRQNIRLEEITATPLPNDLIAATKSSLPYIREAAVKQLSELLTGKNLALARSAREALEQIAENDDSKTISRAAFQALEVLRQTERQVEEERLAKLEAERLAEEKRLAEEAEKQRLAAQKVEEERITKIKLETERLANEKRLAEEAEKQRIAAQKAEEERLAKAKLETERLAQEKQLAEELKKQRIALQNSGVEQPVKATSKLEFKTNVDINKNTDLGKGLSKDKVIKTSPLKPLFMRRRVAIYMGSAATVLLFAVIGTKLFQKEIPSNIIPTQTVNRTEISSTQISQAWSTKTSIANSTQTAYADLRSTAFVKATGTAAVKTALAESTFTAAHEFTSAIDTRTKLIFGPTKGSIVHNKNNDSIAIYKSTYKPEDFVLEVSLRNPASRWDNAIIFRGIQFGGSYRLVINSDKSWFLYDVDGRTFTKLQFGQLGILDTTSGGTNTIKLYCKDDKGIFYVNGEYVSDLNLSKYPSGGFLYVGTQIETEGMSTEFEDLRIWSIQ